MVDITHKNYSLRTATAQAIVKVGFSQTIQAIEKKQVPKGDVFEMSRAAGLLGIKKTSDILPDCHPIPIEYAGFDFEIKGLQIFITCTIKTIYKTGVEVEAMHGASVVALNMYDMLKPIDKNISIENIKLLSKTGGKSKESQKKTNLSAAVIVCSDSISAGTNNDQSGKALVEILKENNIEIRDYSIIPDDYDTIQTKAKNCVAAGVHLIVFTGGTGVSPRDNTPEAIRPLLNKPIIGIEEAMRSYGQQRTNLAMFSRSVAGLIGSSLVLALPGSIKGATDSLLAVFPSVLHIFDIIDNKPH